MSAVASTHRVVYRHRVRYHEVDQQGFLFNGKYLEIADVALTEYFRGLGFDYAHMNELGFDPSLVEVSIQFMLPARFDQVIDVITGCRRVGNSSLDLESEFRCDEQAIAQVMITYVNVDATTATSRPIPERIRDELNDNILQG